jgi:hypothetical protein
VRSLVAIFLFATAVAPEAVGHADKPAEAPATDEGTEVKIAKAHFSTGEEYFAANRFGEAVKEFLEAYRLSKRDAMLYDIARCYQHLDDPGRMTGYYRRYLASHPDATDLSAIEAAMAQAAPRVATLRVATSIVGTSIFIDGSEVGPSPIEPQLLTAGKHRVEARFADFAPTTKDAELPGGQETELALEPVRPIPRTVVVVQKDPEEATRRKRLTIGLLVGGAAVVVAVSVVLGLLFGRTDYVAQARSSCPMGSATCQLVDFGQ